MNDIVKEDIYNALSELLEKQFKEFKWWLNSIKYDGRPNIPGASLEKADQKEVVDLLIQHYAEDALKVCIDVLRKCNRNDLAKKLEENEVADVDAHQLPVSSDYRNYIKEKFATIKDPNAIPGEYVPLNQRYSKLIIVNYHPSEEEKEDEILAMGRKHLEIISKRAESSTSIEKLFNPDRHGFIPQVVVLQGAAGIGKTMMARKIMFDWASQQLYQDKFNYVFYIGCSEMNFHAEPQKISIAEVISNEWLKRHEVKNVIQNILKNEEKLLFIIDGFDELRYSFDQSDFCTDPWKKEPVGILLSSLFQKKILPKSFLIITTRPMALEKLHQCLEHPRCFEILGFSIKEREEYFYKFFENKHQAIQAFRYVKQNDTLFTMCVIPLVSWIICTEMKQEMERGINLQKTPYTLTAIYMRYFSSLLKFHHKGSKQDVQGNVKGFCSLAAEGVWKQQIMFMEEEIKKHSLDQREYLPLFLNQNVFKGGVDCIQNYNFIHLSFQEFFAALFYVLEEREEHHSENWNKNLQTLLESHKPIRRDFAVGFRFLFGFLNEEKRMRRLKKEFGWEISPKNKEFMLGWVKYKINKIINFHWQKEMLAYLYETQDDNFVNDALCGVTKIYYQCNSDMELMIMAYCVQYCQNLEVLYIRRPTFPYLEEEELFPSKIEEWSLDERYVEAFFKAMLKLRNLRELCFDGWSFTESCSRLLAEVFKKNLRLQVLKLFRANTDDRATELLCEGLQHTDCKLEVLVLHARILTESCSRHLAEVLKKNERLGVLGVSLKNADDKAMEMLCSRLKHPKCTIRFLQLYGDFLTESCSRHLAEVLRKNQRLRELGLSLKNPPDEKPMEMLCSGLKHPECTIRTLDLCGDILTESCGRHLAEVLRKNQRLGILSLSLKNPDDKPMEMLCSGLKHPECTIQMLDLRGDILTESCSSHLAEVLRKNQRLGMLSLSLKNSDDKPMEMLCSGLKHPECTIWILGIHGDFLTESCGRHLAEVLRKNQRLRVLSLYLKNPDNKPMEMLCSGLKYSECTIQILCFAIQSLTESCSWHLAEVLRKNQRLRELGLFLNHTDDKTMELLCKGLKHPECTIQTLYLCGDILTETCARHLAEVLRKNQRWGTLSLSLKNSDDKPMQMLFSRLKHPKNTIQRIEFYADIVTESCSRHVAEVLGINQGLGILSLSLKNLDDKPMEMLCSGLKHPECTIQTLRFSIQSLKESCSRHLAEALRKNHSLREVHLFLNNTDDKAMELLCEGLKHPECTIRTLQLNGKYIRRYGEWMDMNNTARTSGVSSDITTRTRQARSRLWL